MRPQCVQIRGQFFIHLPAASVPQEHIRSFKETIIVFLTDQEVILKLTAERKELSHRCAALKAEVKEAEQIRKGVYAILWEKKPQRAAYAQARP